MSDFDDFNAKQDELAKAMDAAAEVGDAEKLKELMDVSMKIMEAQFGPIPVSPKRPAEYELLAEAIEGGNLAEVEAAIIGGMDLNAPVLGEYDTPLIWAVKYGSRTDAMVELLLKHGVLATLATSEGYNILHQLVDTHYGETPIKELEKIVIRLVDAGADIEAKNHYGWTPLLRAVMEGSVSELGALLSAGADSNVKYSSDSMPVFARGQTALMVAGSGTKKVDLLLNHGADPLLQNDDGETSEEYFQRALIKQNVKMAQKAAEGDVDEWDQEYVTGLEASIVAIRRNAKRIH